MWILMTMPSIGIPSGMPVQMVIIGMGVHVVVHHGLMPVHMNMEFAKQANLSPPT